MSVTHAPIKAIETRYNGYRFRSRLEARWAVFFKKLGIEAIYEPQGFDLDGIGYLPDFFLSEWGCYVEVKPTLPTEIEWEKATRLCIAKQTSVIMLAGEIGCDVKAWILCHEEAKDLRKQTLQFALVPGNSKRVHWISEDKFIAMLEEDAGGYMLRGDLERNFFCSEGCFAECAQCGDINFHPTQLCDGEGIHRKSPNSSRLDEAYTAARQARFEHGERG